MNVAMIVNQPTIMTAGLFGNEEGIDDRKEAKPIDTIHLGSLPPGSGEVLKMI